MRYGVKFSVKKKRSKVKLEKGQKWYVVTRVKKTPISDVIRNAFVVLFGIVENRKF